METLVNLESFVRSAELGSFSEAARRLGLTPAAVSRNVAHLERNLDQQLFLRSTHGLTLTETGERLLQSIRGSLDHIQGALAAASHAGQPAGVLKLAAAPGFGVDYLLPLMPAFLARYPEVQPDWHFDHREIDLIGEGFDAAIGGDIELTPGVTARELARVHIVAVATPTYMQGRAYPGHPGELCDYDGVSMRSPSGRLRAWTLRDRAGAEAEAELRTRLAVNDPEAVCRATLLGLGVGLIAMPCALPHLESGALVRLLPDWHMDAGPISLYFAGHKPLPAKTRVFVDFLTDYFRQHALAQRFSAF